VTLNASTNPENVNVAITTPPPKAIIELIIFRNKSANKDTKQPISKGLDVLNPNNNDSGTP
jgi:hypothetical protein